MAHRNCLAREHDAFVQILLPEHIVAQHSNFSLRDPAGARTAAARAAGIWRSNTLLEQEIEQGDIARPVKFVLLSIEMRAQNDSVGIFGVADGFREVSLWRIGIKRETLLIDALLNNPDADECRVGGVHERGWAADEGLPVVPRCEQSRKRGNEWNSLNRLQPVNLQQTGGISGRQPSKFFREYDRRLITVCVEQYNFFLFRF